MDRKLELLKKLQYYQKTYYEGNPVVSDEEFDSLEQELYSLGGSLDSLGEVSGELLHKTPMLSLEKTYDTLVLEKFLQKHESLVLFKIDGMALSLMYKNGNLFQIKSRGDGLYGQDLSEVKKFLQVPQNILEKKDCEIRGEVYCSQDSLIQLRSLGLEVHSLRNTATGLMKRKQSHEYIKYLYFKGYDVLGLDFKLEEEKIIFLEKMKFKTAYIQKYKNNLKELIQLYKDENYKQNEPIDGLVFVYNDILIQEQLGENSKHPRYKLAYKIQGETKITTIKEILWQIGRSGVLTPVALVEPIEISQSIVQKVTLHNKNFFKSLELKKNDIIEIIRSGEVIPKFLRLIKSSHEQFIVPSNCPYCHQELREEDIHFYCKNEYCSEINFQEILFFVTSIGLEFFGESRLRELFNKNIITKIEDIFSLDEQSLLKISKVKEKLAKKMITSRDSIKKIDIKKFLTAFGIRGTGLETLKKITITSLDDFLNLKESDLLNIVGFDKKKSQDLIISRDKKKKTIMTTSQYFSFTSSSEKYNYYLVITGKTEKSRSFYEKYFLEKNWLLQKSITQETNFLVMNEQKNSKKYQEAIKKNIPIITEKDIENL